MKPNSIAEPAGPSPYSDDSDAFLNLIGDPEFRQGHDWVTSPIIEELAACLKHDVQSKRVTI